ncbi:MAG: dephospho-CoA kinase [Lachnospiraceae bacterium]|nr:dephospho-CoA kinase [Lachnospiraceae bacterium]
MKVIGITGGIGSGKSTFLKSLEGRNDTKIVYTDDIAKYLMKKGETAYKKIVFFFGDDILLENGEINRNLLGDIVFNNKNKLAVLNSIVHPIVKNEIISDITNPETIGRYRYYFIESALLLESHYEKICDEVWYIYSPEDVRIKRLVLNRNMTAEHILEIMSTQMSDVEIREKYLRGIIPHTIDNGIKEFDVHPKFIEISNWDDELISKDKLQRIQKLLLD